MQCIVRPLNEILKYFNNKERNYLIFFQILNAGLSIVFGKIVALYITPEAFGTFNIQNALYFFVFSLLFQPFLQYIKSNFFHLKTVYAFRHLFRFYLMFLAVSIILLFLVFRLYLHEHYWIILFVIMTLILNSVFMLVNDYFSITAAFGKISMLNLFKNALPILFLLVFVFVIGFLPSEGHVMLWWAQIVGFLGGLYFVGKWYRAGLRGSPAISAKDISAQILSFTWPLMILSFWNWLNSYADRFIIEKFLGLEAVGIYNANVGLGSKVFLMVSPLFITLLTPAVFNPDIALADRKRLINRYLKVYILLIIGSGITVYLFHELIGQVFLSPSYRAGFFLIYWSSIAYGIITAGYLLEMLFYAEGKTRIILYANIISAIAVVVLNIIFLPKYGLPVSAYALMAASVIKFIYLRFIFSLAS